METKEFLTSIKEANFYYTLISRKLEVEEVVISTIVVKLLREYEDVTLEDLSYRLPRMRDIQHHIDLNLGSSLPN